jgi:hypothetical protein
VYVIMLSTNFLKTFSELNLAPYNTTEKAYFAVFVFYLVTVAEPASKSTYFNREEIVKKSSKIGV